MYLLILKRKDKRIFKLIIQQTLLAQQEISSKLKRIKRMKRMIRMIKLKIKD